MVLVYGNVTHRLRIERKVGAHIHVAEMPTWYVCTGSESLHQGGSATTGTLSELSSGCFHHVILLVFSRPELFHVLVQVTYIAN